jgi:hypothetical protein
MTDGHVAPFRTAVPLWQNRAPGTGPDAPDRSRCGHTEGDGR